MRNNAGAVSGNSKPNGKEHWTQTPEGRKRMAAIAAMGRRALSISIKRYKKRYPTPESRAAIALEWKRSGLPARVFAPKHQVSVSALYNWAARSSKAEEKVNGNGNNANANAIIHARRTENAEQEQIDTDIQYQNQICTAVGECKGFLRIYAESIGVPSRIFARRVGELLYRSSHG